MRLTAVLHTFLNRVFSQDPKDVPALLIAHSGPMSWEVADDVLTLTVAGGLGPSLTIDLTQYTVASLAAYISGQVGYAAQVLNSSTGGFAAYVLLDGEGDQSVSLTAFTSLRWGILDAFAWALNDAESAAAAAPAQMATTTASGGWLDQLGSYLGGIMRGVGEPDSAYGPRIPATVLQPKCNNFAIAEAIERIVGLINVVVKDVTVYGPVEPVFNGGATFNGAYDYSAEPTVEYGMFDITGYAAAAADLSAARVATLALVETMRASGTHLRTLNILQDLISDYALQNIEADGTDQPLLADGVGGPM